MCFDEQEFSVHLAPLEVLTQIGNYPMRDKNHGFWAVSYLQGDDSAMLCRWISSDIGEIAIEGDEDRVQFGRLL